MAAQHSNRTILALFSPELKKKLVLFMEVCMEQAYNMTCSRRQPGYRGTRDRLVKLVLDEGSHELDSTKFGKSWLD